MIRRLMIFSVSICGIIAILFWGHMNIMTDLVEKNICHNIDPSEWDSIVSSYERPPILAPAPPYREVTFELEFPLEVSRQDTLIITSYASNRQLKQTLYDGAPPADGRFASLLASRGDESTEEYWLSISLIRSSARMTCGWSMEETLILPAMPHSARWKIRLLTDKVSTSDGGTRLTEILPR